MTSPSKLAAAAVLAVALVGCSSPTPLTLAQVATKAGCEGATTPGSSAGTKDAAKCTKAGRVVYLYTFADDKARDAWLKVAQGAGALGSFETGTSYVIQTI